VKALILTEIADKWVRENFRRIQDYLRAEPILRGDFQFREFEASKAGWTC
jgi:hypothetical protein